MSSSVQNLVFDLDGTLVDSAPGILESFAATLHEASIEPQVALIPALIGPPLMQTLALLAGSDEPVLLARLAAGFKAHYDTCGVFATPAYADIQKLLSQLHSSGLTLHICTNKRLAPSRALIDHLGWQPYFASLYSLDMVTPSLPGKPAVLARQLIEQNIDTQTAAYIGDRREDAEAAKANGLPFIYASWGYGAEKRATCPDDWRWLESPTDLLAAV